VNVSRKGLAVVAALAIALITGCTLPRPPGDSPLRYRDQVFSNVSITSDLKYGQAPDANNNPVDLKLDLYQPTGDTQTLRPALVWVHGGSFSGGDKTNFVPVDVANTFSKMGYVVVSINYRLLGSGCVANPSNCTVAALEAQHDAQAAVRWLRSNAATYKIDPSRIGIGGESAGAITATLVGLHSEDPGTSGNPGFPVDRRRLRVRLGRPAERPLREQRRRGGGVLPRHGRRHGLAPVVGPDRRGDAQRGRARVAAAAERRGPRALGAVPPALPAAGGLLPVPGARPGARQRPAGRGGAG